MCMGTSRQVPRLSTTGGNFFAAEKCLLLDTEAFDANNASVAYFV